MGIHNIWTHHSETGHQPVEKEYAITCRCPQENLDIWTYRGGITELRPELCRIYTYIYVCVTTFINICTNIILKEHKQKYIHNTHVVTLLAGARGSFCHLLSVKGSKMVTRVFSCQFPGPILMANIRTVSLTRASPGPITL